MPKNIFFVLACLLCLNALLCAQEDYLKIDAAISKQSIRQGKEGILKLKITPRNGLKISYIGFKIKLQDNANLSFPKVFFTASELDLQTKQEDDTVFLEFEKDIPIQFKVNENSLIGKQKIYGEVVFTAVFPDNWSLKTYQEFTATFNSKRNLNDRKR